MKAMRFGFGGFLLLALLGVTGCAGSRPVVSGRSSVDYNSYDEDLSAVRPVYNPVVTTGTTETRPAALPAPVTGPASPRKTEIRKPTGPVEAMHVNRRLDLVLDTIATQNRRIRYAPGFRIQVYVGNQRHEVDAAKLLVSQNFPELSPYLSYVQPTYKLKVGDFMRRIDAERYYASLRQLIPSVQLQADKVDIRRSLLIK